MVARGGEEKKEKDGEKGRLERRDRDPFDKENELPQGMV